MSKTTRFAPVLVAAVLALFSLSGTAQAAQESAVTGTDTASVATVAQQQTNIRTSVDGVPRDQVCEVDEWPFKVTCDIYSDDPRLVVTAYIWTPFGYEQIEQWTFRADGRECVSGFGHEACVIVDFDWSQGCVTGTVTFDDEPILGPETWCWSKNR